MNFTRIKILIFFDDAHRATVGPVQRLQARERGGEPGMMQVDALAPGADAGAAPDLLAEAGAAARAFQAQCLQAQLLLVGDRAQGFLRRAPRAEQAA